MSPSSAWPSFVLRWSKPLVGQPVKCPTARKAICSGTWKWVKYAQSVAKKIVRVVYPRPPPRRNVKTPLSNNDNLVFSRSSNYAPLGTQIQRSQTALLPGYLRPATTSPYQALNMKKYAIPVSDKPVSFSPLSHLPADIPAPISTVTTLKPCNPGEILCS